MAKLSYYCPNSTVVLQNSEDTHKQEQIKNMAAIQTNFASGPENYNRHIRMCNKFK